MKVSVDVHQNGKTVTSIGLGGLSVFSTAEVNALKELLRQTQSTADANTNINAAQEQQIADLQNRLQLTADQLLYLDLNAYTAAAARKMENITGETSGVTLLSDITGEQ